MNHDTIDETSGVKKYGDLIIDNLATKHPDRGMNPQGCDGFPPYLTVIVPATQSAP